MPRLEFGLCGIDNSVDKDKLHEILEEESIAKRVSFVLAFQLAYQGTPEKRTPKYSVGSDPAERRYGGLVYAAWDEILGILQEFPDVLISFHLNETADCRYVSGLLSGEQEMLDLIGTLVRNYRARHIQVNLTSDGVPVEYFTPPGQGDESAAVSGVTQLLNLCRAYPHTLFLVPIAQMKRRDGTQIDTEPFFMRLLQAGLPPNLCAFFDCSAGTGKEPDKVPELPQGYVGHKGKQFVGFTGGINKDNVHGWLDKYNERAREHGCSLISDAQTGFRVNKSRSERVDMQALKQLVDNVREWGARQPAESLLARCMEACGLPAC